MALVVAHFVGAERRGHHVFYTIRPPPALLQVRCRAATNIRLYYPELPSLKDIIG
jgi:hypothetical protein